MKKKVVRKRKVTNKKTQSDLLQKVAVKKKKAKPSLKTRINSALRQVWRWSDERKEALAAARCSRGNYHCANCGRLYGPKEIKVDHIEGYGIDDDWNARIARLFCPSSGLQCLCEKCHKAKGAIESVQRSEAKKRRKSA